MKLDLRPAQVLRSLLGLFAGAVVSTLLFEPCLYLPDWGGWQLIVPRYSLPGLAETLTVAGLALMFALPLGLVVHAILSLLKLRALPFYLISAAIAGGMLTFVMAIGPTSLQVVAFCAAWGATCALIAWLICRPDKDAATA